MTRFALLAGACIVFSAAIPALALEDEAPLPCNSLCRSWMGRDAEDKAASIGQLPAKPASAAPTDITPVLVQPADTTSRPRQAPAVAAVTRGDDKRLPARPTVTRAPAIVAVLPPRRPVFEAKQPSRAAIAARAVPDVAAASTAPFVPPYFALSDLAGSAVVAVPSQATALPPASAPSAPDDVKTASVATTAAVVAPVVFPADVKAAEETGSADVAGVLVDTEVAPAVAGVAQVADAAEPKGVLVDTEAAPAAAKPAQVPASVEPEGVLVVAEADPAVPLAASSSAPNATASVGMASWPPPFDVISALILTTPRRDVVGWTAPIGPRS